jgi:hypothetical protein
VSTRSKTTKLRKYIPSLDASQHRALHDLLRDRIKEWNAEGWAITGHPPQLRVTVLVDKKLAEPPVPAHSIQLPRSLGGGLLKLAIHALHRQSGDPNETSGTMPAGAGVDYLAPGSPINCDGERIGIGAVIAIGNTPHIVTCGHAVGSADKLTTTDGNTEIATLRNNFFPIGDRLDAAVFTVDTSDGLDLLHQGSLAPSWCASFQPPCINDHDADVTFWPTAADNQPSFVEKVMSCSACIPSSIGCGYVMLARCTKPGDSGSSLQLGSSYYALASRRDGNNSFFTPITTIVDRLTSSGLQVTPWSPQ